MRLSWKKVSAVALAAITAFSMQMSAIAAVNPFTLQGTEVAEGSTEFTVKLAVPEDTQMDAYEITVGYDTSVLAVKGEEGAGYQYTDSFLGQYGQKGLCVLNSLPEKGEVIFAGATADSESASYQGDFAQISFSILDNTKTAEDVLTSITVKIGALTVADVEVDVTGMETSYPITFSSVKLGDVDGNGAVDLTDANLALKAALNIVTLTDAQKKAADADRNGEIELTDANLILKAALSIITLE